jgi:hypothetical protein
VEETEGVSHLPSLVVGWPAQYCPLANDSVVSERARTLMMAGSRDSKSAASFGVSGSIFPAVENGLLCGIWAGVGNSLFSAREVCR